MLWFFERDDESLKLETRYDNDTSEFVVIVRYPNGHEHSERFTDGDKCRLWLEAFEQNLAVQLGGAVGLAVWLRSRVRPSFLAYILVPGVVSWFAFLWCEPMRNS